MKYRFIHSCAKSCADQLPVEGLCSHLGVARSGYYKWLKQERTQAVGRRAQEDQALGEIHSARSSKQSSGSIVVRMAVRAWVIGCANSASVMADGG